MFQKILVALDESDASALVFNQALSIAKGLQAKLLLLHVLSPDEGDYPIFPTTSLTGIEVTGVYKELHELHLKRLADKEAERLVWLQGLQAKASEQGVETEFTQNLGSPGGVICKLAENWDADLIIVGRRGRTGFREWMLGSVSNYVLHHAPCSVLTIQSTTQKISESFLESEHDTAA
jgi:nucleotide-binding universal stress UspA family protein